MPSRTPRPARAVTGALLGPVLALVLLGCGSEEAVDASAPETTPSSTTSAPAPSSSPQSTPAEPEPTATPTLTSTPVPDAEPCSSVWKAGAPLPRGYDGCLEQGAFVERDATSCSSGQFLVTYADRFYGVLGGQVVAGTAPLSGDAGFRRVVRSCTA